MTEFTHFNEEGHAKMVDVTGKGITLRTAMAAGTIYMAPETVAAVRSGGIAKGDVLSVAQVAGIMAAKRTAEIIPMCHPLMLSGINIRFMINETSIDIFSEIRCRGETGVEMEALTAGSAAALTIYDMCKALQKDMKSSNIRLLKKTGGVRGDYTLHEV